MFGFIGTIILWTDLLADGKCILQVSKGSYWVACGFVSLEFTYVLPQPWTETYSSRYIEIEIKELCEVKKIKEF